MSTAHPFRFGVTLLGAASRQEWIAKVHQVEDLGYSGGHVVRCKDWG